MLTGFRKRISRAMAAYRSSPLDIEQLSQKLDAFIQEKQLDTGPVEEKQASRSKLSIRDTDHDLGYYSTAYSWISSLVRSYDKIPRYEDPDRDNYLDALWKKEPILAGAVYSMCAKFTALNWSITGRRRASIEAAKIFSRAAHMGGSDWGGFISSTANDFYTANRGSFWETPRAGSRLYGKLSDLGHIDALCCTLTGNSKYPVYYASETTGQVLKFRPGEFKHFSSLPSPRERMLGVGYCAVDRAVRAATLLIGLHDYDEQKLNNLPPEGLAAISGLTMDEFQQALYLWKVKREQDNSLTFPQVLWLIGSQPNAKVEVAFASFSQMPESFNRNDVVTQYVQTLALDFGVDAREFWAISSGSLGTAAESEIQHIKAKGKGPGEFISITERQLNDELPEDCDFAYDTQDIEEDANAAAVAKAVIDAYFPLYNLPEEEKESDKKPSPNGKPQVPAQEQKANPRPDKPDGSHVLPTSRIPKVNTGDQMTFGGGQPNIPKSASQVITKDQLLRLLADKGVIPDWMVNDQRVVVTDREVRNREYKSEGYDDDFTKIVYDSRTGLLKEERMPPIELISKKPDVQIEVVEAEYTVVDDEHEREALLYLKQKETEILDEKRDIHGDPIPEREVTRGARVTRNTLRDELERWRSHPLLAQYAPSEEELEQVISNQQ